MIHQPPGTLTSPEIRLRTHRLPDLHIAETSPSHRRPGLLTAETRSGHRLSNLPTAVG